MPRTKRMSDTEYEQASASLRHYSSLRYAILTVLIAINAALISTVYGRDAFALSPTVAIWLRLFGLASALAFGWLEYLLDTYLKGFGDLIEAQRVGSHWGTRPKAARGRVIFATMSVHLLLALFWLMALKTEFGF